MVMTIISVASLVLTLVGFAAKAYTVGSAGFAIKDLVNIDNVSEIKGFDESFVGACTQAITLLFNVMDYIHTLIICCAFLCIIFNAFKLWAGTIELKKVYVDSIYKCLIVIVIMNVYPAVVNKTIDLASELGIEASGGAETIENAFASLANKVKKIFDTGLDEIINTAEGTGMVNDRGKRIISDSLVDVITKSGLTREEAVQYLAKKNIIVGKTSSSNSSIFNRDPTAKAQKDKENAAKKKFKNDKTTLKFMKQSLSIINSLQEVLTGVTAEDIQNGQTVNGGKVDRVSIMTMGDEALDSVFYNPYLKTDNQTKRLSISTMLKTAIIIQEILSSGALSNLDIKKEKTDKDDIEVDVKLGDAFKHANAHGVVKIIGFLLKIFMYKLFLVVAVMLAMVDYCLAIIEFLIVAAVSMLFVPLYFIDATKQYAANLIKTTLSFFVKIFVTTMMVFFVMGLYINMGSQMVAMDIGATTTFVYFAFNCLIGIILIKSAGKVASAVMSGNPSLGIGDVVNEMRGMNHMAHSAGHMVSSAGRDISNIGNKAHDAAGQMANQREFNKAKGDIKAQGANVGEAVSSGLKNSTSFANSKGVNDYMAKHKGISREDAVNKLADIEGKKAENAFNRKHISEARKDFNYKAITGHNRNNIKDNGSIGYIRGDTVYNDKGIVSQDGGFTAGFNGDQFFDSYQARIKSVEERFGNQKDKTKKGNPNPLQPENGL